MRLHWKLLTLKVLAVACILILDSSSQIASAQDAEPGNRICGYFSATVKSSPQSFNVGDSQSFKNASADARADAGPKLTAQENSECQAACESPDASVWQLGFSSLIDIEGSNQSQPCQTLDLGFHGYQGGYYESYGTCSDAVNTDPAVNPDSYISWLNAILNLDSLCGPGYSGGINVVDINPVCYQSQYGSYTFYAGVDVELTCCPNGQTATVTSILSANFMCEAPQIPPADSSSYDSSGSDSSQPDSTSSAE